MILSIHFDLRDRSLQTWSGKLLRMCFFCGLLSLMPSVVAAQDTGFAFFDFSDFYRASSAFGAAFGQLTPHQQAVFPLYDGTFGVALSNQFYTNFFGVQSVPGGFPSVLGALDSTINQYIPFAASPSNFNPTAFNQLTANDICIPGLPPHLGGCL